ncbi:MAG: lysine--tRNA ligase [Alphaproteobacteria bacterium GM202ARS2]|nr:lysine--tRNA ligase [Alphaproteobacteria bacterium GM202ARS2]
MASTSAPPPYSQSQAWPFIEAQRLLASCAHKPPQKGFVAFATGYGPSGLPHIGTFGEVLRTTMVQHAFSHISSLKTTLYTFSDDMDALRSVPDNVPQPDLLQKHLGMPLTSIPDPYDQYDSFGAHNNAMLRRFLDSFGFQYDFQSATDNYKRGVYDKTLLTVLEHHEAICALVRPTLGPERRKTYSPFLPICPQRGVVLQARVIETHPAQGTLIYHHPIDDKPIETPVTQGHCKLQWKADWAMRWSARDIDYEMAGKDLSESVTLSAKIARVLGKTPPLSFIYELFLDEQGEKISKSKGNGLSIEEWLDDAPKESLAYFMYQHPKRAKRLYRALVARTVDAYLHELDAFNEQEPQQRLDNPVWHIHRGEPPAPFSRPDFTMLANLASASGADDPQILWSFIQKFEPKAAPHKDALLDTLVAKALHYAQHRLNADKTYDTPTATERTALQALKEKIENTDSQQDTEALTKTLQAHVYQTAHDCDIPMKQWFSRLYRLLLGQESGPRLGSFVALYGLGKSVQLIDEALKR